MITLVLRYVYPAISICRADPPQSVRTAQSDGRLPLLKNSSTKPTTPISLYTFSYSSHCTHKQYNAALTVESQTVICISKALGVCFTRSLISAAGVTLISKRLFSKLFVLKNVMCVLTIQRLYSPQPYFWWDLFLIWHSLQVIFWIRDRILIRGRCPDWKRHKRTLAPLPWHPWSQAIFMWQQLTLPSFFFTKPALSSLQTIQYE